MNAKCIPRSKSSREDSRDALPALRGHCDALFIHLSRPSARFATRSSETYIIGVLHTGSLPRRPVIRDRCG